MKDLKYTAKPRKLSANNHVLSTLGLIFILDSSLIYVNVAIFPYR